MNPFPYDACSLAQALQHDEHMKLLWELWTIQHWNTALIKLQELRTI